MEGLTKVESKVRFRVSVDLAQFGIPEQVRNTSATVAASAAATGSLGLLLGWLAYSSVVCSVTAKPTAPPGRQSVKPTIQAQGTVKPH